MYLEMYMSNKNRLKKMKTLLLFSVYECQIECEIGATKAWAKAPMK